MITPEKNEEIKFFIKNHCLDKNGNISSKIKHYTEILNEYLLNHWAKSINELYYCSFYNIAKQPKCYCAKNVKFLKFSKGYQKNCSLKCSNNNDDLKEKRKKTIIKRYGVDNPSKSEFFQNKKKETFLKKYGVDNPMKSKEIQNKTFITNLKKYGSKSPLQNKEIYKKMIKTNNEKYGTDFPTQLKKIKEKSKKSCIKKYGVNNPAKSKKIQEKIKKTNLERYGVEHNLKSHIINIENLNSDFINKNFSENGLLNRKKIINYFNLGKNYFSYSNIKNKNIFQNLFPFKNEQNKTQNEIYNLIYAEEIKNKQYITKLFLNDKFYLKYNTNINKTLELDILDLNKNIAIEYNGLMFHSFGLNNHSMFNNSDKETENKFKHLLKTQLCEEKGIQLFHIMENEWLNERQRNIWVSMINGKLNKHERIYARKTIVKEIKLKDKKGNITNKNDTETIRNFLNTNHMQGYLPATVNIGLFVINNEINHNTGIMEEKEELVSMIALSKPRMSKKYQWELIRYATKLNTTIVGGGSKLISFFEKFYNPESLISYANRRWSTGQFYKKTGFTFSHYSDPNYYYFKPELFKKLYNKTNNILENKENLLYTRNHFQKHKLKEYCENNLYDIKFFDENLSETNNMYNNDYRKIYDSGNMIFTKIYN